MTLMVGLHMCYNENFKEGQWSNPEQNLKNFFSIDHFLQFENVKVELLVIAYQERRGEYVKSFCTYCPSRSGRLASRMCECTF